MKKWFKQVTTNISNFSVALLATVLGTVVVAMCGIYASLCCLFSSRPVTFDRMAYAVVQ